MYADMKKAPIENAEEEAAHILYCLEAVTRLKEDKYENEAHDAVEAIYGKLNMGFKDDTKTIEFWYENIKGDEEKEQEARELLAKLAASAEKQREADLAIFTETLKHRLLYWWT